MEAPRTSTLCSMQYRYIYTPGRRRPKRLIRKKSMTVFGCQEQGQVIDSGLPSTRGTLALHPA